jgi:hypothetical protein
MDVERKKNMKNSKKKWRRKTVVVALFEIYDSTTQLCESKSEEC